jgi:tetratricopeptide (TPR) repeat protein
MSVTIRHRRGDNGSAGLVNTFREAAIFHQQGKLDEAARCYAAVVSTDPRHADALNLFGVLRAQQGKFDEAVSLLRRAVERNPASAPVRNNLGMALNLARRYEEAIAPLESAIALDPQYPLAHNSLGVALEGLGRHQPAAASFERALALNPNYVEALGNLGSAQRESGQFSEARRWYERVLAIEPRNARILFDIVQCGTVRAGDPHLSTLEAMAENTAALPEDQQIWLHFALGKAYRDLGQDEPAFRHLLDGNALKRRQVVYDEAARLGWFDRIRTVFSAELLKSRAGFGNPSERPIFIVGMMRSGSTLVEQILASHPEVFAAGERPDFSAAYQEVCRSLDPQAISPDIPPFFTGEQIRQLGDRYLARLEALTAGRAALRITDKMLSNFSAIGLIRLALPNARILHTVRDPIDTCLSSFSQLFSDDQPFTYDFGELGRYYRAYARLMEHWRRILPEGAFLDVRYEELVADFESQVRRILDYCGLEWNDACLSFYDTDRPVRTASQLQVRQPLYTSSVGRWRPGGTILRPLLEGLGLIGATGRDEHAGTDRR